MLHSMFMHFGSGVTPQVFATWSPTDKYSGWTLSNSNLTARVAGQANGLGRGTIGVSSGKWYWEITLDKIDYTDIGVCDGALPNTTAYAIGATSYRWDVTALKKITNTGYTGGSSYGTAATNGDIIGIALDMDGGTITLYKNGVSMGVMFSGITGTMYPLYSGENLSMVVTANFGQFPFAYMPPSGFNAGLYTGSTATYLATGGFTYQNGSNVIHIFAANSNLISYNTISSAQYLIVAGGGSGGGGTGGGGGAGGVLTGNTALSSLTSYPIVIGSGGTSSANGVNGKNGANSSFNSNTAIGGGAGGRDQVTAPSTGGSGGGGGLGAVAAGAAGTAGQGFAGGTGGAYTANYATGGGGGAGNVGLNAVGTTIAGNGGPGISSSITGNVAYYGGGGGGGVYVAGGSGAGYGGIGGGGNAVITTTGLESTGKPYTGGGGGGGVFNNTSGAGATGIIVVSYTGTAPPTSYATGLAGRWTFDASDATDTSGNGNNGSLVNSPTFGTGHNGLGTAITFPATGYVNVPSASSLESLETLTLAFWIKWTLDGNNVVIERLTGGNTNYGFQTFPAGVISWMPGGQRVDATGAWNDGQWHHVCGTYQRWNTTSNIYVDGALRGTSTTVAGPTTSTAPLTMGSRSGTAGFSGSLDEVVLFNRVLSIHEIAGLSRL